MLVTYTALTAPERYMVLFAMPQGAWVFGGVVGRESSSSSTVVKRTPLLSISGVADVDRTLLAVPGTSCGDWTGG